MTEYNMTSLPFNAENTAGGPIDLALEPSTLILQGTAGQEDAAVLNAAENSVSDELIRCLRDTARVDIERIAKRSGCGLEEVLNALKGSIFQNPDKWNGNICAGWETADEYLSGNIRKKLVKARMACKVYGRRFRDNVDALERVLPPEMRAEDIYVTLGSPWVPAEIIDDFINYLIQPHSYHMYSGTRHDEETGSWEIPGKSNYSGYIRNTSTFGTSRINALRIIDKTLNMKIIRITDEVPSANTKSGVKRVLNQEETANAQEKQKLIIEEFKRWVWCDGKRKERLKKLFEAKYGSNVARRFNGRFLEFPEMSDDVTLYPYQKDAVARILLSPNTLLAHDVGAGKTYIMIAAAMELRRLGMAERCMFVVPNNLVEQWRSLFLALYPNADLLCIEPKDMVSARRNQTMLRIMNDSYDGIIIAYSCFDRIPLSRQAHINALKKKRDEMERDIFMKEAVTSRFKKKLSKLSEEISKPLSTEDSDDEMIYFNDLGIDRLFVDEAHNYKNISIPTQITGVYGINRNGSVKCDSLMAKVHFVQKTHNGGGVVMATGTPITNSISDIYVFQQYLQSGELDLLGLQTFDGWVGMFAEKTTEFEIAVDTGSYRLATRFSRFHNIPELTTILASIADFHRLDDDGNLPVFNGHTDVIVPRTPELKEFLEDISRRADLVHNQDVNPNIDNMLKITGDGRKAALDIRLIDECGKGDKLYSKPVGRCKAGECAERAAGIWRRTENERLTQLIFCDTSTPKADFNMYDDLKRRLINLGVNQAEIAYIHDADTDEKREELFENVREGIIRILIGSTFKLGLGVNVQDRLIAVHHLDLPWRPADMVQREGRILRTGNMNDKVEIYRYVTEGSFDAYSWQLLETKQRFITDILSGTIAGRSGSDVDDTVLNYAEIKALALGNPLLKSRVETRNELSRLTVLQRKSIENRLRLEQRYEQLPDAIAAKKLELATCIADADYIRENDSDPFSRLAGSEKLYAEQRRFLRDYLAASLYGYVMMAEEMTMFDYRGFSIVLPAGMDAGYPYVYLVREGKYRVDISEKKAGILTRIDNFLNKLEERVAKVRRDKEMLEQEMAEIAKELAEADSYADRIDECFSKLEKLDEELGVKKQRSR